MTDWKADLHDALDEADAAMGVARMLAGECDVPGDADAQDAYEALETVIERSQDAQAELE